MQINLDLKTNGYLTKVIQNSIFKSENMPNYFLNPAAQMLVCQFLNYMKRWMSDRQPATLTCFKNEIDAV